MTATTKQRHPITCPSCGETRTLGYAAVWAISKGLNSGICDPCAKKLRRRPHKERVLEKIGPPKDTGCWPWLGHTDRHGYGHSHQADGKSDTAYRVVYELLVGPIPAGLELDHLCRNPVCVNPTHLEPVTRAENLRRAAEAVRTDRCPSGHLYNEANTYITKAGYRQCRTCKRIAMRERYRRACSRD